MKDMQIILKLWKQFHIRQACFNSNCGVENFACCKPNTRKATCIGQKPVTDPRRCAKH